MGLAAAVATTAIRVARMRGRAPTHAFDLDPTTTLGEGLGAPVRLLVLGDSAARGYGLADASDAYPQQLARRLASATGRRVHVTSLATDGHRIADVAGEQVPLVKAARPDAVVVSVGVNDAVGRTRRDVLRRVTRDLLVDLRAAADGAVLALVTCPDLRRAPGLPWPLGVAVGWRCRQVAAVQAEVARELAVATVPLPAADPEMFGADGFHPGRQGQVAMARRTAEVLLDRAGDVLDTDSDDRRRDRSWISS